MKIPTPIGQFITKNEIIICPDCKGDGILFQFPDPKEFPVYLTCFTCEGKRVIQKIEKVVYKRITEDHTTDNQL